MPDDPKKRENSDRKRQSEEEVKRTIYLGADPGGVNHFGVSALVDYESSQSAVVSSAFEAAEWFKQRVDSAVNIVVGIDAPMWWSGARSGARNVDGWLRETYNLQGGEVQQLNSLRGACLVQGVMLATYLRIEFPNITITESHPKALRKVVNPRGNWLDFVNLFGVNTQINTNQEHEVDAFTSALAAKAGFTSAWMENLIDLPRAIGEDNPSCVPWGPVHYYWPDSKWLRMNTQQG